MTPTAERGGDRGRVDPLRSASHDGEHALVHLDEDDERPGIREIDDLVREVRHPVDVLRPSDGGEQHVVAVRLDRLERVEQVLQETALRRRERRMQVVVHEILARAVPEAPRQRVDVALRRSRVGERASVLVDPERERGGLQHSWGDLTLGEDPDERRGERPIGRQHRRLL